MDKRLYKSRRDRVLCGVCGGIGEYFDVDPVIIRLLTVLFALTGSGVLVYIIAAVIMKDEDSVQAGGHYGYSSSGQRSYYDGQHSHSGGQHGYYGGAESYGSEGGQAGGWEHSSQSAYGQKGGAGAQGEGGGQGSGEAPRKEYSANKGAGALIFGVALLALGTLALAGAVLPFFFRLTWKLALAIVLIALGLYFLLRR